MVNYEGAVATLRDFVREAVPELLATEVMELFDLYRRPLAAVADDLDDGQKRMIERADEALLSLEAEVKGMIGLSLAEELKAYRT